MGQHRLIVDKAVIQKVYERTNNLYAPEKALRYQLFYQMSRLQKGANTLLQDDRIDALQIACHYWIKQLSRDQEQAFNSRKEDKLQNELNLFFGKDVGNDTWIKL